MDNHHALAQTMTTVQITSSLPDGSTVTVTQSGPGETAREREDVIHAAIDTHLCARIRVTRTLAPFRSPTPMVPASSPAYAAACENPDPEGRVIA